MGKVKYNLRKPSSKTETVIMLIFHFEGDKLRLSTGKSILPKNWNANKQRAKETMEFKEHHSLNQYLEKQSSIIIDEYNNLVNTTGYIDKDVLKENYLNHNPHKRKRARTFWEFFEEFIEYKRSQLGNVKDYDNSLRKHLLATEKLYKTKATFEGVKKISNGFTDKMKKYLTEEAINSKGTKGLTVNSIGKQFKNLKVFLNWCFENNFIPKFSIKHLVNTTEEVDAVYLEQDEIDKLSNLKLKDENEKRVRDGFILACNTALRFSDLSSLRSSHIVYKGNKGTIHIQQTKTRGSKIAIPINKISEEILKRYDNSSPINGITSIQFNNIIRDLCKRVNIDENVVIYRTERGKRVEYDHKKYDLVSSHTGRRTFCTLMMKKNVPIDMIMSVSGHKSYKNFFRYLKMKPTQYAEEIRKYMD
jgi:integrase